MKIYFLLIAFLYTTCSLAQDTKTDHAYNARYQYQMDDFFLNNRKLLVHLDTIVPAVFEELDSARSCGEGCSPDYYVAIVMGTHLLKDLNFAPTGLSNNSSKENYRFSTQYGFNSFLLLKDKDNVVLKVYYITDKSENFEHVYDRAFDAQYQSVKVINNMAATNSMLTKQNLPLVNPATNFGSTFAPLDFANSNHPDLQPTALEKKGQVLKRLFSLYVTH